MEDAHLVLPSLREAVLRSAQITGLLTALEYPLVASL